MPPFSYLTIQGPAEGHFRDKGSRFMAYAYPVSNVDDVKKHLDFLRKEYHDARHQGYAYILGPEKKVFRAFDDGEPNHSTGDPILGQIRSRDLTNTLVVVVRYFGGVKLGVSGLIVAYRTAAANALNAAIIVEQHVTFRVVLRFGLASTPEVMRLIKEFNLSVVSQEYAENGQMVVEGALRVADRFKDKIALLQATGSPIAMIPEALDLS